MFFNTIIIDRKSGAVKSPFVILPDFKLQGSCKAGVIEYLTEQEVLNSIIE